MPINTPIGARRFLNTRVSRQRWENSRKSSVLRWFRDKGGRIGNQAFFQIQRKRKGDIAMQKSLLSAPPTDITPKSSILPATYLDLKNNYSYTIELTGIDKNTDFERIINRSISSSKRLSLGEIQDIISDRFAEGRIYDEKLDNIEITHFEVYHDSNQSLSDLK